MIHEWWSEMRRIKSLAWRKIVSEKDDGDDNEMKWKFDGKNKLVVSWMEVSSSFFLSTNIDLVKLRLNDDCETILLLCFLSLFDFTGLATVRSTQSISTMEAITRRISLSFVINKKCATLHHFLHIALIATHITSEVSLCELRPFSLLLGFHFDWRIFLPNRRRGRSQDQSRGNAKKVCIHERVNQGKKK